jgi:post-segregation antitoxin (ccd killing protein)
MRISAGMKAKEKTMPMNISVPVSLKRRMNEHREINWSALACKTFERQLRAQEVLGQFAEEGISEEEALERAMRVQHPSRKVISKAA